MTPAQLKEARRELRLTLSGMADALGVTGVHRDRTIRRWETGDREIPTTIDALVARLLDDWRRAKAIVAEAVGRIDATAAERGAPRAVSLAYYPDADTLAALVPDDPQLTWGLHQAITRATVAALHERGIEAELVPMRVDEYRAWLGARPNTAANRARYVTEASRRKPYRLGLQISGRKSAGLTEPAIGWCVLDLAETEAEEDGDGPPLSRG